MCDCCKPSASQTPESPAPAPENEADLPSLQPQKEGEKNPPRPDRAFFLIFDGKLAHMPFSTREAAIKCGQELKAARHEAIDKRVHQLFAAARASTHKAPAKKDLEAAWDEDRRTADLLVLHYNLCSALPAEDVYVLAAPGSPVGVLVTNDPTQALEHGVLFPSLQISKLGDLSRFRCTMDSHSDHVAWIRQNVQGL